MSNFFGVYFEKTSH